MCIYRIKTGYIVWHHESFQASTEVLGSYPLRKMTDYCTHTVLVGKYVKFLTFWCKLFSEIAFYVGDSRYLDNSARLTEEKGALAEEGRPRED